MAASKPHPDEIPATYCNGACPGCHARLPLYAASETNFFFKAVESPLTFVKNPDGEVTKFVLHYNGHAAEATKLKEQ